MVKAGRRGNGEGSILQRKDGDFVARISLPNGKKKEYRSKRRSIVVQKMTTALKQLEEGLTPLDERQSTQKFFTDWLESYKPAIRATTYATYETLLRVHVIPVLGRVKLAALTPQHLQRLYADRLQSGLSPQSVRKIHAVIHRGLEQAVRWNLLFRNPADFVSQPSDVRHEIRPLSPEGARRFLEAAREDPFEALYVLAITTGMRQGELLALRWKEIDLGTGSLHITGTVTRTPEGLRITEPKTKGSRRRIDLGKSAVESLKRHRQKQAVERLKAGPRWQDNDLVFANEVGNPVEASNLRRRSFEPLLARAGLDRMRFHDLRHSAATLLLGEGIHPKIVSERLGHSRVGVTLDLYSHVTPTMQRQAVDAMEALLGG
jgi:integrase